MKKFLIGKVLKPRGLKGELKVQILTNLTDAFNNLKKTYINKQPHTVLKSSIQNDFAFLVLEGVNSVEAAEEFRDAKIYVTKASLKLQSDDILAEELIGFVIENQDGKTLGTITQIESFGERIVIMCGAFSFPYEDDFVVQTDIEGRKIIVREAMLVTEEVR